MSRRLSIIIPVYNVEPYVGKTLSSVFDTTASADDFEVVVVNDGTKDGAMDVVRKFADRSNMTIVEQENQGLSAAREKGLSVATGDYVWFLDSDDYLEGNGVKTVLDLLEKRPEASVLMFPIRWIQLDGSMDKQDYQVKEEQVVDGKAVARDLHLPLWIAPRFVIRRSLMENEWVFFPAGLLHEDEYFGPVLMYLAERVCVQREPLYNYVQRSGSIITSRKIRSAYDFVSIHKCLIRFMDEVLDPLDKEWFRPYCLNRLLSVYRRFSDQLGSPEFRRFARTHGLYVWREWKTVYRDVSLKWKLGRLCFFVFPALKQRLSKQEG